MIIGIAGSFGAGKGAVVEYLVDQKGFKYFSASNFITEEVKRRGLPIDRDSMIAVANDLRLKYSPSYIIDELYAQALQVGGDAVIESLRAVAEARKIKELGGLIIGVDADSELRYARSMERGGVKDGVSFEKWISQEQEESNISDPTKQSIFEALKEADYTILNSGSLEELHEQIDKVLLQIKK